MNAQLRTNDEPVSLGNWILTLIVLMIPLVNIIMMFVWGFSSGTQPSKQNYCRALLIITAVVIALWIVFAFTLGAGMMHAMHGIGGPTL